MTTDREARYLVDHYYRMQDDRKRAMMQMKAVDKAEESKETISLLAAADKALELEIAKWITDYAVAHPMWSYFKSVKGIGPIIAAGLLAHIDINKCPTVGHIYQFAGIAGNGQKPWLKKTLRPHNAKLKTLCWKIGQSFMKAGGYYGDVYRARKVYEIERNERGDLAAQAENKLKTNNYGKTTDAYKHYKAGRLPPAQIDARARRYAVKLFLAHFWEVWYRVHFGKAPPLPYPIAHLDHAHYIPPPGIATDEAMGNERTRNPERAKKLERTIASERAKKPKSTGNLERAPRRKRAA
jgi:hypothetical protein